MKLSSFWSVVVKKETLMFLNITVEIPEVLCVLCITSDLKCSVYIRKLKTKKIGKYSFPLKDSNVNNLQEIESVINIDNQCDYIQEILNVVLELMGKLKKGC